VAQAALPRGMNRFLPAIFGVAAADVVEIPVNDRRREHGASHYGISRTLVVLRDLLALRFMQRDPERAERGWAVAVVVAAGVDLYGVWSQRGGVTLPASLVVMLGLLIWWNLRRFNAARTHGVCRVRREYSAVHGV